MNSYQEPKYDINENGNLFNRQSGQEIPDDEPVIIFRARDIYAADILLEYAKRLPAGEHKSGVMVRALQFQNWANAHPDRMKEPDTVLDQCWTISGKME